MMGVDSLRTQHFGATHAGRRREHNEDVFLADAKLGLFVVCDGVGGRAFGDVAAYEAASAIWEQIVREAPALRSVLWDAGSVAHASALVRDAMQRASNMIYTMGVTEPGLKGMCTTASVVLVANGLAVVGQVGDSRVYLGRGEGVHQLTEDHTLQNLLIKQGLAKPSPIRRRRSAITRALGLNAAVEVDIAALPLADGDRLLLCTDGLHECLEEEDLFDLFELDVEDAAPAAIHHANTRGGRDNITALFVDIVSGA